MKFINHIHDSLAALEPRKLTTGYAREAAVLMPFFKFGNEPYLLLTLRTQEVETHKGQISFPGGMREENEDLWKTALRETHEEVGIDESRIKYLGKFHDYISITGYRVTPFAGYIETPFKTIPQAREVAEILHVPIHTFLDPNLLRVEKTDQYPGETNICFYSFGSHQIWGLTARILKDFFDMLEWTSDGQEHVYD
jgi:8-oxo-dGTP pyrophosphatase MutT (NUDIX family)